MPTSANADIYNVIERKLKLVATILTDYIYETDFIERWVTILEAHSALKKEIQGPSIQKQLYKIRGVSIWMPTDVSTLYSLYDLFLYGISDERLGPSEVQYLFPYFYPVRLIEKFVNSHITDDIYSALVLFTKDYETVVDYVEKTASIFYNWSQEQNESILDFFEGKNPEFTVDEGYVLKLLSTFRSFENNASKSTIAQWNYLQHKIFKGESLIDILKEIPNLYEIFELYNQISEDPSLFPQNYYKNKRFDLSPQMLFDLQEPASIDKQYFISEYNQIKIGPVEKITAYINTKLSLLPQDDYTTRLSKQNANVLYALKLRNIPQYSENVYEILSNEKQDLYEQLQSYDREIQNIYNEMTMSQEFLPKALQQLALILSTNNMFRGLQILVKPVIFDSNSEIFEFIDKIKSNIAILMNLEKELKELPLLPAPNWPDTKWQDSLLWLTKENPTTVIEMEDKPKYISHAVYHALVDYQTKFADLMLAHDTLNFIKQSFNVDWWLLRLQVSDYLRFFTKLEEYNILPPELKFMNYDAVEDLFSTGFDPEPVEILKEYINVQYVWLQQWVENLNSQLTTVLGSLASALKMLSKIPTFGADVETNLAVFQTWLEEINFIETTNKIEWLLGELVGILNNIVGYYDALYDFVFTRNWHVVIDYYYDDVYEIFEAVPDLQWEPVIGDLSFQNLINYMKQNQILLVLGLKQLNAILVDLFKTREETLADAIELLEDNAFKKVWPLIAININYNLGIEINPLYILPFAFEYGVV